MVKKCPIISTDMSSRKEKYASAVILMLNKSFLFVIFRSNINVNLSFSFIPEGEMFMLRGSSLSTPSSILISDLRIRYPSNLKSDLFASIFLKLLMRNYSFLQKDS